jgi:hypothetical protein
MQSAPAVPARAQTVLNLLPNAGLRQTARFKPFRIDPMNRETAPGTGFAQIARFKPFRIDPMNREPTPRPAAIPGRIARFENLRIYPMNPDTPPAEPSTQTARFENLRINPMIPEPTPRRPGPAAAPAERPANTSMQRGAGARPSAK